MKNAFKKFAFLSVALLISAAIFWIVFLDKQSKEDVFEYSLNLLGDKLMAMVPNDSERSSVKELYDKFVKQAVAREVAPEQVETVAANILNLCNLDTTLNSEQAEKILKFTPDCPSTTAKIKNDTKHTLTMEKSEKNIVRTSKKEEKWDQQDWENLGKRIASLTKFNDELKKILEAHGDDFQKASLQLQYRIENGLKISMDYRLRKKLEQLKSLESLKSLKSLKELDKLDYSPIEIDVDSLRLEIFRSLKETGLTDLI